MMDGADSELDLAQLGASCPSEDNGAFNEMFCEFSSDRQYYVYFTLCLLDLAAAYLAFSFNEIFLQFLIS